MRSNPSIGFEYVLLMTIFIMISTIQPIIFSSGIRNTVNADTSMTIPVLIDLGRAGISLNSTNILVTTLCDGGEIHVWYTSRILGIDRYIYAYRFLYRGVDTSSLSPKEIEEIYDRIRRGENISKDIVVEKKEFNILARDLTSRKLLVFIPSTCKLLAGEHSSWLSEALRKGYYRRLIYTYNKHVIYVYYSSINNSTSDPAYKLDIPFKETKLYIVEYGVEQQRIIEEYREEQIRIGLNELSNVPEASYIGREEYGGDRNIASSSSLHDIWYYQPWSHETYGSIPYMLNTVFHGSSHYSISDVFRVLENTTRYELWVWLMTDKTTIFELKIYINGNKLFDQYVDLDAGIMFGGAIIVNGNYIAPGNRSVDVVLDYVMDPDAHIAFHASVVARSSVVVHGVDDYYKSYYKLRGYGDIFSSSPGLDKPLDESYEFIHDGEYMAFIRLPRVVYVTDITYPFYQYPYIYLYIESSEEQKYNRYIDLYINGDRIAHVKTYSNVPDGTPGKRWAWIYITSGVLSKIVNSMRMRQSIIVKVKIEDYNPGTDSKWYIESFTLSTLSRPVWMQDSIWHSDPVSRLAGGRRVLLLADEYTGINLYNGEDDLHTDVKEYNTELFYVPVDAGRTQGEIIWLDYKHVARMYIDNGYLHLYTFMEKTTIDLHISITGSDYIKIESYNAYASGENTTKRGGSKAIEYALWVIGLGLTILSFGTSSWVLPAVALGVQVLSYPGLFVYENIIDASCPPPWQYGKTLTCKLNYDPGWILYPSPNSITFLVVVVKYNYKPWSQDDTLTVSYTIKTYMKYELFTDSSGQPSSIREGYQYDANNMYIRPFR